MLLLLSFSLLWIHFAAACTITTQAQLPSPGWFVSSTSTQDCCTKCTADLLCVAFMFHAASSRCYTYTTDPGNPIKPYPGYDIGYPGVAATTTVKQTTTTKQPSLGPQCHKFSAVAHWIHDNGVIRINSTQSSAEHCGNVCGYSKDCRGFQFNSANGFCFTTNVTMGQNSQAFATQPGPECIVQGQTVCKLYFAL